MMLYYIISFKITLYKTKERKQMKNQKILLFIILLLVAVIIWQYNHITQLQNDLLNVQICILEDIPLN